MIERLIIKALRSGIQDLIDDPARINVFFRCLGLTEEESAEVRTLFLEKPPNVILQYPRKNPKFPLFAVVLGDEKQTKRALGDLGGFVGDLAPEAVALGINENTVIRTSVMQHMHYVQVYTEHPDVTLYYYELAKHILVRSLDFFKQNGVLDTALSGRDMGPDENYAPEWIFVRRLTFQTAKEFQVFDDLGTVIREVRGLYVNEPGRDRDELHGVRTRVTPVDSTPP